MKTSIKAFDLLSWRPCAVLCLTTLLLSAHPLHAHNPPTTSPDADHLVTLSALQIKNYAEQLNQTIADNHIAVEGPADRLFYLLDAPLQHLKKTYNYSMNLEKTTYTLLFVLLATKFQQIDLKSYQAQNPTEQNLQEFHRYRLYTPAFRNAIATILSAHTGIESLTFLNQFHNALYLTLTQLPENQACFYLSCHNTPTANDSQIIDAVLDHAIHQVSLKTYVKALYKFLGLLNLQDLKIIEEVFSTSFKNRAIAKN